MAFKLHDTLPTASHNKVYRQLKLYIKLYCKFNHTFTFIVYIIIIFFFIYLGQSQISSNYYSIIMTM